MSFEVKPGSPQVLNVAGIPPKQIELVKKEILSRLDYITPAFQSMTIYNRTKTCKVTVYYESSHIRIEVTNEEEDSKFRIQE